MIESMEYDGIPGNEFDDQRLALVHPPAWKNPSPRDRYHLVVIGAGTAGLVTAAGAAGLGAKVALIEKGAMGGDCLNVGCVPSKAIIASARRARVCRESRDWGVSSKEVEVDFAAVMNRMRQLRAGISPHDSAGRFQSLGVDVFFGTAKFVSPSALVIDESLKIGFRKAVICTGARAAVPAIPGLKEVGYQTNESIFSLAELPKRLLVVGGGPIGCELAQAFALFGSTVTLVDQAEHILSRELPEAAALVAAQMRRDGVQLLGGSKLLRFESDSGARRVVIQREGKEQSIEFDEVLVATGRAPNVHGLGLEQASVKFDPRRGVETDRRLRTTNSRIYAAGDVCSRFQFTHAADFQARSVIRNALFLGRANHDRLLIPRCTFTTPEIASVGLSEAEAAEQGIETSVFQVPFSQVDRAILEGEAEGFVRVVCPKGKDRILGATIVAENAGDLLSPLLIAMNRRIGLGKIGSVIHCYPTRAEAIRKLGDMYSRTRLTPTVKRLFDLWLHWTR